MIYIALQDQISPQKLEFIFTWYHIQKWVYLGEDSTWRVFVEHKMKNSRISISKELDDYASKFRQLYIDWIGGESQKNDTLGWWASEIPAKDPYSHLYLRICFYAVGKDIIATNNEETILIICSSPTLAKELIIFAQSKEKKIERVSHSQSATINDRIIDAIRKNIFKIGKTLPPIDCIRFFSPQYSSYLEEHPLYRHQVLKEMQIFPPQKFTASAKTILFFTYVDDRNFTHEGKYRDPHFAYLADNLRERGYNILFIPRVLPTICYADAIRKLTLTGEKFLFLEQFIDKQDLKNSQQQASDFVPNIDENIHFLDIPMKYLIRENLIETHQTFSSNILLTKSIQNMAKAGLIPERIVYTCEGQSWESALITAIQQSMPKTKIVAYDNVTFSKMMLSMFPSKKEHNIRPFPDLLITNGPLYRDILVEGGYPRDHIRVGCALRHTYLWDKAILEQKKITKKTGDMKLTLLVASAISHGDSVDMITKISTAFAGNMHYNIRIKCHPLINVEDLKESLGKVIEHANITFTDQPIRTLLASADILFYTYTSVCYEALQFKVPPVCVHMENFLNIDKLDIAPAVRWTATTQQDLKKVVLEIVQMSIDQRQIWEERAAQVVKEALQPIGSECIEKFVGD